MAFFSCCLNKGAHIFIFHQGPTSLFFIGGPHLYFSSASQIVCLGLSRSPFADGSYPSSSAGTCSSSQQPRFWGHDGPVELEASQETGSQHVHIWSHPPDQLLPFCFPFHLMKFHLVTLLSQSRCHIERMNEISETVSILSLPSIPHVQWVTRFLLFYQMFHALPSPQAHIGYVLPELPVSYLFKAQIIYYPLQEAFLWLARQN